MRWLSPDRVVRRVLWRLVRKLRMAILRAPPLEASPPAPAGCAPVRIGPAAPPADRDMAEGAMRAAGEPAGLVDPRLAHGDELFGWSMAGRIVCFGWVAYRDRAVGPVRLADAPGRVFLYNFHTLEAYRGRGLYPALLLHVRSVLGREGATEIIIDVNVKNAPSAKGIEKAGFVPVARVAYMIFLDRWHWMLEQVMQSGLTDRLF